MRSYCLDLREKIAAASDQKLGTQRELAEVFGVGKATVERIIRLRRQTGSLEPKPHRGGHTPRLDAAALERVRQILAEDNDLTLDELSERLRTQLGVQVGASHLCRIVGRLGLPSKNSRSTQASVTASESSGDCVSTTSSGARSTPTGSSSSTSQG